MMNRRKISIILNEEKTRNGRIETAKDFSVIVDPYIWKQFYDINDKNVKKKGRV